MAIANAIPELWAAGLLRGFDKTTTWGPLVTDLSAEVAPGGNKLNLSEVTGTVVIRDYVAGTALVVPQQAGDAGHVLNLDQQKYFNIAIEDIERFQAKGPVFEAWTRKASMGLAQAYDKIPLQRI